MPVSAALLLFAAALTPAAAQSLEGFRSVETAAGSTLLVPDRRASGRRPLVVLLPFTGGSAQDLLERWYAQTLPKQARAEGWMLLLPSPVGGLQDYATDKAWAATLARYERDLRADIAEALQRHDADPARIVLAGYSMGGDLAWALPQRDPERYAGMVVMGSRASYRDAKALARLGQRGARVFFFMGEDESEARMAGARAALAALEKAGVDHRFASAPGEHVWAPPKVLAQALDYVLGGKAPAAAPLPPAAAGLPPPAPGGAPIVAGLPPCRLQPFEDAKGLNGYRDARGPAVIKPRFAWAGEFGADGLAPVAEGGGWGYVDCAGRSFRVIAFDNGPDAFSEGLARFEDHGRVGYLNRRGEVVIAARFESAGPFCGGLARAGRSCETQRAGEHRYKTCRDEFFINLKGDKVPTPDDPPEPPHCGGPLATAIPAKLPSCAWTPFSDKASGLQGYRDRAGKVTVKPRFDEAHPFDEDGLAAVREGWSVGYLGCDGKVFEVLFDGGPDPFQDDLVRFEVDSGYGFRNRRGETVIAPKYSFATPFCSGLAKVGKGCSITRESESRALEDVECSDWSYIGKDGRPRREPEITEDCEDVLTEPTVEEPGDGDAEEEAE